MSAERKYLKELQVLSERHPLAQKSPQELCTIALDGTSPNRLSAIKRLGNFMGKSVTMTLVELTNASHGPDVRQHALEALAKHRGELVTNVFKRLIRDDDIEVRKSVVKIARLASEQVQTVVSLLAINDEDDGVREIADDVFFSLPDLPDKDF